MKTREQGIRRNGNQWEVRVMANGHEHVQYYPLETPLRMMRDWRRGVKAANHRHHPMATPAYRQDVRDHLRRTFAALKQDTNPAGHRILDKLLPAEWEWILDALAGRDAPA